MNKFFVTFAQRYRDTNHPVSSSIHPDGYITIEADNKGEALKLADEIIGNSNYSMMYTENEIKENTMEWECNFPLGNLHTITKDNKTPWES